MTDTKLSRVKPMPSNYGFPNTNVFTDNPFFTNPTNSNPTPGDYTVGASSGVWSHIAWQALPTDQGPTANPFVNPMSTPTPSPTPASTPTPSANQVAWWKLDETSGTTAFDSSGNNNTGTLVNGPVWTAGKINNALQFSNNYAEVADSPTVNATGDFTVAVWIKTTQGMALNQWPDIVFKQPGSGTRVGYEIVLHNSTVNAPWYGQIYVNGTGYIAAGASDVADGAWHHLVLQRQGSTVMSYQDGVLANTNASASNASIANTAVLRFGRSNFTSPYEGYYNGAIDDVRIYNRALSASEIQTLYNEATATPTPTPTLTPSPLPTNTPTPTPTPTPGGDTIKPTVTITSPANGSTVSRSTTITVTANATDNIGVTQVRFLRNGTQICTDTTAPYSCAMYTDNGKNKTVTYSAQAFDAAGNSNSTSVSVVTR
jgi:hypothetical protein